MKKAPIGILDGGFEGINIFEKLVKKYPYESFIYINDLQNYPYEGKEIEDINNYVKRNVDYLLSKDVKAIICVNASIIEYCIEYLESVNNKDNTLIKLYLVDSIINYINLNFEQKNMLLLGKEYILKANLFQKNFKYNHLYNVASDELENIIFENKTKTSNSFKITREVLRPVISKPVDIIIFIDSYLENLSIELKEYCNFNEIIDLAQIISSELMVKNIFTYTKEKGRNIIVSNIDKNDFYKKVYWIKKYSYEKLSN